MGRRIGDEAKLIFGIARWSVLSAIVGVLVGLATTFFLRLLETSVDILKQEPLYFLLLPFGLFLSIVLVKYLAPNAEGHGTEKVIEAVHQRSGKIDFLVVPVKLIATVITIAVGGSVGKEGPSAQIGSGIASLFADIIRLDNTDRRKIVICGISAGFAAVFGTPIAGAIFGIEVLFVGKMLYELLLPSIIAGIVSYEIAIHAGIRPFYEGIAPLAKSNSVHLFLLAGLFFGVVALIFITTMHATERFSKSIKIYKPLKGFIGGTLLIILALLISKDYLGLGLDQVKNVLNGDNFIWYAFLVKIVFTSITLEFGGSGGVLAPVFFVGSAAGDLFALIFHVDTRLFSALGMIGTLAAATNTPIACIIMAGEMFGPQLLLPASIVCAISYIVSGHNSIYGSQVLEIKKHENVMGDKGIALDLIGHK